MPQSRLAMTRPITPRLLLLAAAALLVLDAVHVLTGLGNGAFDELFALWFQPVAFLG